MRAGTLLLVAGAVVVAAFSLLNWSVIVAETPISLGVAEVSAPMGLILLGAMVSVAVLALLMAFVQQARAMQEFRRSEKELRTQRELADRAEASRFVELRSHLDEAFTRWQTTLTESMAAQDRQRESAERRLMERMDEDARVVSALLGEMEDKLDRNLALRGGSLSGQG